MQKNKSIHQWLVVVGLFLISCTAQDNRNMVYTNELIHETSPYLLQHAHNPVEWHAWNAKTLEKAKKENKLLLVSIGYSSCHWCHVMEHESFEDTAVAEVMNAHFINVKVDREERPDVDQVYMTAVQLMTGSGGWPLNCIALPDGRPIWGGTYFKKDQWMQSLQQVADLYVKEPSRVVEYAENLTEGVVKAEGLVAEPESEVISREALQMVLEGWKSRWDTKEGGPNRAPKFPLPNNHQFLLDYGILTRSEDVLKQVELTLDKMERGGIYDQIGGGFARYSTDALWKALILKRCCTTMHNCFRFTVRDTCISKKKPIDRS